MTSDELLQFRDSVAFPAMKKLFEATVIPEGFCCINELSVSFLDGRSCGVDSEIKATGLLFKNGEVEEYEFCEIDMDFAEFVESHKNCVFMADGTLKFCNELDEFEINTVIRQFDLCARICPDLESYVHLNLASSTSEKGIQFEKMMYLFKADDFLSLGKKPSLAEQMVGAAMKAEQTFEFCGKSVLDCPGGR